MAQSNTIDMLHGPLLKKILVFAMPLAASSILQQLFNSTDVAVVGQFSSHQALAAVGSNGPIINLIVSLLIGLSVGSNVVIANNIGAGNKAGVKRAAGTTMVVAAAGGLLMMIVGQFLARPMLELVDTPPDVIDLATLYLRILFCGMPLVTVYNFGAAILRSKGDTRRPLYILLLAGFINTGLNLVFVIVLHMSVAGVAIATMIANAVSALLVVRLLLHEEEPFRLRPGELGIDMGELKRIMRIGLPAGLQGMVFSISNVCLLSAINGFGSVASAGSAACLNFEMYSYFLINCCGAAATTFVGQNYAADKLDRCRRVFAICMGLSVASCGLGVAIFTWQSGPCLSIFSTDRAVIAYGVTRMHWVLAWQWLASSYEIAGACMRGMGHSTQPALLTVFGTCILRLVWVFAVSPHYHDFGILLAAYPISWVITGTMVIWAYVVVARKARKRLTASPQALDK